jgi:hypothetical protein
MQKTLKRFSPIVFTIALICFLLPWINLSCQGQKYATFSGLQLVTGTKIEQHGIWGERKSQKVDSEPLAVAVLLLTILGVALSFLKSPKSSLIPSIVGVVAFILLLLLKSKIDTDATNQGKGMIQVEYAIGFWLVLILFIAAIALNGYLYFRSRQQAQATTPQT